MTLFRGSGSPGQGTDVEFLRSDRNLSDVDDADTARQNLGLASLSDISSLTPTDSLFIVGDGSNWVGESGATARTSMGVSIGSDVQAWDQNLDDLSALTSVTALEDVAGLSVADSNFIVGNGTSWVAESAATARTSLGLGSAATSGFLDEDGMASDSATAAASQQSIVRYNESLYNKYVAGTNQYPTIQSAINAVAAGTGLITNLGVGEVYVPTKDDTVWTEQITIPSGKGGMRLRGQGIATYIRGTGAHTLTISEQDCQVSGFWIDQIDASGSFDGIHIDSTAPETRLDYVDVDAAPRNGIYVNGGRCEMSNVHLKGGDVIAIEVDVNATRFRASNLMLESVPALGLYIRADHFCVANCVAQGAVGVSVRIDGNDGYFAGTIFDGGATGIRIDGNNNIVHASVHDTGTNAILINGNNNTVFVNATGSTGDEIVVGAGATGNRIFGFYTSISDSGTGTVTYA